MRMVLLILFLIIGVTGIVSPKYGVIRHALADQIAYQAGSIRGDGPFAIVAVNVIEATKRSPYLLPSELVQSDSTQIIVLAKQITKGKKTDTEKSKAIFYWMTHHIAYDYQEYENDEGRSQFIYKGALETLMEGKGICMDYALLNAALHRAVGIEAKIVYGEGHAWNQVELNGIWVDQDTTYGAGYIDDVTHQFVQQYNEKYFSYSDMKWEGNCPW